MDKVKSFLDNLSDEPASKQENTFEVFKFDKEEGEWRFFVGPNKKEISGFPGHKEFLHWGFTNPLFNKISYIKCGGRGCPLCVVAKKFEEKTGKKDLKAKFVMLFYVLDENFNRRLLRSYGDWPGSLTSELKEEMKKTALVDQSIMCDFEGGRYVTVSKKKVGAKIIWNVNADLKPAVIPNSTIRSFESAPELKEAYRQFTHQELSDIAARLESETLGGEAKQYKSFNKNEGSTDSSSAVLKVISVNDGSEVKNTHHDNPKNAKNAEEPKDTNSSVSAPVSDKTDGKASEQVVVKEEPYVKKQFTPEEKAAKLEELRRDMLKK